MIALHRLVHSRTQLPIRPPTYSVLNGFVLDEDTPRAILASLAFTRGVTLETTELDLEPIGLSRYKTWPLQSLSFRGPVRVSSHKTDASDDLELNAITPIYKYFYDRHHLGQDVDAIVLDSGVDCENIIFGGRATCISRDSSNRPYYDGHGTSMASLIASKPWGVATKANIVSVQLGMFRRSSERARDLLSALDLIKKRAETTNRRGVVSFARRVKRGDAFLTAAFENLAMTANLMTVVPAGNSGHDACKRQIARSSEIFTVGGHDALDRFWGWSGHGACVDVLAPAVDILGVYAPSTGDKLTLSHDTGTSYASAFAAGVAAAWLSKHRDIGASMLKRLLVVTGAFNQIKGVPADTSNLKLQGVVVSRVSADEAGSGSDSSVTGGFSSRSGSGKSSDNSYSSRSGSSRSGSNNSRKGSRMRDFADSISISAETSRVSMPLPSPSV
ncbi:hypothetical protein PYCC9005_004770 [Savitreella phatthalungensis]